MLTLGLDIGTSGIRTAVLDQSGAVVATARAAHLPQTGAAIDASLWWTACAECITAQVKALEEVGYSGQDIAAIGIDGTSGSMVLTDAALNPVSPALMYNSKGFEAEAARIDAAGAPPSHITRGSNSALARAMRLVSLAEGTPVHLLHQADFIAARLMGCGGLSDHNNALKTGYDPERETWPDWVDQVIDPKLLPDVHPVGTALAGLDQAVAADLGLNPRAQVHAGTTDSTAAFIAAAPLEAGVAVTSIGSTLALKVLSTKRIDLPEQGLYSHKIGPYWVAGGASNTGGAVLLTHFNVAQLEALSTRIDPEEPDDLNYYPLNAPGERFPINDPDLAPRLTPRPADDALFLKGLFEGIARIEAEGYRLIRDRGGLYPTHLVTAGGAAGNVTFRRIRERHLGLRIDVAAEVDAAVGAARICSVLS